VSQSFGENTPLIIGTCCEVRTALSAPVPDYMSRRTRIADGAVQSPITPAQQEFVWPVQRQDLHRPTHGSIDVRELNDIPGQILENNEPLKLVEADPQRESEPPVRHPAVLVTAEVVSSRRISLYCDADKIARPDNWSEEIPAQGFGKGGLAGSRGTDQADRPEGWPEAHEKLTTLCSPRSMPYRL